MKSRSCTAVIVTVALLAVTAPAAATTPNSDSRRQTSLPGPAATAQRAEADASTDQVQGSVLFNQLTTQAQIGVGMPAMRLDPPTPFDAEGADDFHVFAEEGWTIGQVVFGTPGFGLLHQGDLVDVRVYGDTGGAPGEAVCSYDGLAGRQHGTRQLRVALPTPCVVGPGRYWLSLQGRGALLRYAVATPNPHPPPFVLGARAHWRNPDDGWGTGCVDWSDVTSCLVEEDGEDVPVTGGHDMHALFQVCGALGTVTETPSGCGNENADSDLSITLAVDNGDPEQCGTATTLDVEVGDRVNVCYTVTNTGNAILGFHWIRDDLNSRLLTEEQEVAPGESLRFNRLITATRSRTIAAEAQATDVLPWYLAMGEGFDFVDISGSGTPLDLDDDGSANVTMPFRFDLFGVRSDDLCINNNGFLLFGWDRPCDGFHDDVSVPNESVPLGSGQIAPFWDDLFTGGNVYFGVVGAAPNRRFVVQWNDKNHYNNGGSDPGGVTFEVILDEATRAISFQYLDTTFDNAQHPEWDHGGRATVGFQSLVRDGFGGSWRQHSFNAPVLDPESGLTWPAMDLFHATASASAALNVATPAIDVAPDAVTARTVEGGVTSVRLRIANTGDRNLLWQVGDAPSSTSHFPASPSPTRAAVAGGVGADVDSLGWAAGQKPLRVDRVDVRSLNRFATRAYASRFEINAPPFGPRYQRINDIANPEDTEELASLVGRNIFAGEFIGADFSRQFAIDECCRQLLTIDTETGETSIDLGRILGVEEVAVWRGLAWDATTERLFVVGTDTFAALPTTRFFLARLDLGHDVVADLIGELPGLPQGVSLVDIAVDPAGRMFGVDIQGNRLYAIDKRTAAAAPIGGLGFNAVGALGLDFDDATGLLHLASLDVNSEIGSLYTVDTQTGLATVIDQLGDGSQHAALAIASGAPCVPPTDVPWLRASPASGTAVPGGSRRVTVRLDAADLTPGTHEASVCVGSNDPLHPVLAVPVTLTVTPADEGIALIAEGRRVRGVNTVDLTWQGLSSAEVDIFRNGTLLATVPSDGGHTDSIGTSGRATYRYWVCAAGTSTCSRPAVVRFEAPTFKIAVNTGGHRFIDRSGVVWLADRRYEPGGWGRTGNSRQDSSRAAIAGTTADRLFKDRRLGVLGYRFDRVPAGRYRIVLLFAELDRTVRTGQRRLNAYVDGRRVLTRHDVVRHVGRLTADQHTVRVRHSGGPLRVRLTAAPGSLKPMLSAVRVLR
jgi:hypothetical protein